MNIPNIIIYTKCPGNVWPGKWLSGKCPLPFYDTHEYSYTWRCNPSADNSHKKFAISCYVCVLFGNGSLLITASSWLWL